MQHRAEFFVEQAIQNVVLTGNTTQVYRQTTACRKGHFHQGDKQTSIGAIMVGQQQILLHGILDKIEEIA